MSAASRSPSPVALIPGITVADAGNDHHSVPIAQFMDRIDADMLDYRRRLWRRLCEEERLLKLKPVSACARDSDHAA